MNERTAVGRHPTPGIEIFETMIPRQQVWIKPHAPAVPFFNAPAAQLGRHEKGKQELVDGIAEAGAFKIDYADQGAAELGLALGSMVVWVKGFRFDH